MPVDPQATTEVTAFRWVPDFAEGLVRDLRIRWALEEIGRPYRVKLLDAMNPRPADYFHEQPFGQVPAYRDEAVQLFESGAILIHLGLGDERLLPSDESGRGRAIAWLIAALNSVEPMIFELVNIDIFNRGQDWAKERRPQVVEKIEERLRLLAEALGERDVEPVVERDVLAQRPGAIEQADVCRATHRQVGKIAQRRGCVARGQVLARDRTPQDVSDLRVDEVRGPQPTRVLGQLCADRLHALESREVLHDDRGVEHRHYGSRRSRSTDTIASVRRPDAPRSRMRRSISSSAGSDAAISRSRLT